MEFAALQGIYCGPAPDPAGIWLRWNFDPALLVGLLLLTFMLRRERMGLAGVAVLAVAFVSPLCALSAALFSARVVHHVLLVAVAAPLLATVVRTRFAPSPLLALVAITVALWLWHLPVAYDFALGNKAVYWIMQATLIGPAVLFWVAVLNRTRPPGPALLAVLGAYVQMALLGALLTFAPDSLYAIHATAPMAFGFTALADQQLGGLIMWVPAGLPYLVIGGLLARRGWRVLGGLA